MGLHAGRLDSERRFREMTTKRPQHGNRRWGGSRSLSWSRDVEASSGPEMKRVAEREPHLTPEQVRDEVAAGRMVIPANISHLKYDLDPMAIGRASKTKVNANMGRFAGFLGN